jgi:hypothetical protein
MVVVVVIDDGQADSYSAGEECPSVNGTEMTVTYRVFSYCLIL